MHPCVSLGAKGNEDMHYPHGGRRICCMGDIVQRCQEKSSQSLGQIFHDYGSNYPADEFANVSEVVEKLLA